MLDVARSRRCGRGGRLSRHDCRFTQVSRAFHEVPRLATPVSRALHAWLARPCPNIPEDARPSRGQIAPTGTNAGASAR